LGRAKRRRDRGDKLKRCRRGPRRFCEGEGVNQVRGNRRRKKIKVYPASRKKVLGLVGHRLDGGGRLARERKQLKEGRERWGGSNKEGTR